MLPADVVSQMADPHNHKKSRVLDCVFCYPIHSFFLQNPSDPHDSSVLSKKACNNEPIPSDENDYPIFLHP